MFVHKALNDALNTKNFKTTAGQLVKKSGNITLLTEEFQVGLSNRDRQVTIRLEIGLLLPLLEKY